MHVVKWRKERQSLTEGDLLNIRGIGVPSSPGTWSRPDSSVPVTIVRNNIIKMVDYERWRCKLGVQEYRGCARYNYVNFCFCLAGGGGGGVQNSAKLIPNPSATPVPVTDICYPWNSVNFIFPWQLIFCVSSATDFLLSLFLILHVVN